MGVVTLVVSCSTPADVTFKKPKPEVLTDRYQVAILITEGVYNTEVIAPLDIFQHTAYRKGIKAMQVFLVADTHHPVRAFEGNYHLPDYNYLTDSLPKIDILVVPSAEHHLDTDLSNDKMIDWVRKVSQQARYVTSHCDGAFVLAKAGVLKDKACTTFPGDIEKMKEMFPTLDIRSDVIFVHDGSVITSAGGARSFDAALYLCELLYGKEIAHRLGKRLVLDWDLDQVPHIIIQ